MGAVFLSVVTSLTGWAEEPSVATATWEVKEIKGEDESRYQVTIYQVEAPGGTRWIWRAIDPENGTFFQFIHKTSSAMTVVILTNKTRS